MILSIVILLVIGGFPGEVEYDTPKAEFNQATEVVRSDTGIHLDAHSALVQQTHKAVPEFTFEFLSFDIPGNALESVTSGNIIQSHPP